MIFSENSWFSMVEGGGYTSRHEDRVMGFSHGRFLDHEAEVKEGLLSLSSAQLPPDHALQSFFETFETAPQYETLQSDK